MVYKELHIHSYIIMLLYRVFFIIYWTDNFLNICSFRFKLVKLQWFSSPPESELIKLTSNVKSCHKNSFLLDCNFCLCSVYILLYHFIGFFVLILNIQGIWNYSDAYRFIRFTGYPIKMKVQFKINQDCTLYRMLQKLVTIKWCFITF